MIDVCICTYNPRSDIFKIVLQALVNQTIDRSEYQVWIIDNNSAPAITDLDLSILSEAKISYHLISEPILGIISARLRAIVATDGDLLLFVDDDNELAPDYIEQALVIASEHPEFGCFGGKLLLPAELSPPRWLQPLLAYTGIRDLGDREISQCLKRYNWAEGEPPTAGMTVRRSVLERYRLRSNSSPVAGRLGRIGKTGLLSCEDSLLVNGAYELSLDCAYQPRLKLIHHIDPSRFRFVYQVKLLFNYGRSAVILRRTLQQPLDKDILRSILSKIKSWLLICRDLRYLICQLAVDIGYIYQAISE